MKSIRTVGLANMIRLLAVAMILLAVVLSTTGCGRKTIEPGYVGIKVNLYGKDKGVDQKYTLETGRVWYASWKERIYEYPTSYKRVVWCADKNEGDTLDQSIPVSSADGLGMSLNVAILYRIRRDKIPSVFMDYRQDSDALRDGVVRDKVRKILGTECAKYKGMEIRTTAQGKILRSALAELNTEMGPSGFEFDDISFISRPAFTDSSVETSINKVMTASMDAEAAEQKVRQSTAEAQQEIERAKGEAQANAIKNASVNDKLIAWRKLDINEMWIKKWNGEAPKYMGGNGSALFSMGQ